MINLNFIEILLMSFGVAADATAVSICKGLKIKNNVLIKGFIIGMYFGIFQCILPILGYFLGNQFSYIINNIDHWLVFFILLYIGVKMIIESLHPKEENDSIKLGEMLILALATSIDAFSVGISIAFIKGNIVLNSIMYMIVTWIMSIIGVYIGHYFGNKWAKFANIIGGLILILIGIKILLTHIGLI